MTITDVRCCTTALGSLRFSPGRVFTLKTLNLPCRLNLYCLSGVQGMVKLSGLISNLWRQSGAFSPACSLQPFGPGTDMDQQWGNAAFVLLLFPDVFSMGRVSLCVSSCCLTSVIAIRALRGCSVREHPVESWRRPDLASSRISLKRGVGVR